MGPIANTAWFDSYSRFQTDSLWCAAGCSVTTPIIVTDTANYKAVEALAHGDVRIGNALLKVSK